MTQDLRRVRNTTDEPVTTTVTINDTTPVVLAVANPRRMYIRVCLDSGLDNTEAFVREYPATQDDLKRGEILMREISANHSLYKPMYYTFADNVYTGEISAIAVAGTFDVHVTEG